MPILNIAKNNDIYYERIEGDLNKPTLVFLHEGLGSCTMWKDFPKNLCQATGSPGLIYDRNGYGNSSDLLKPRSIHYLHESARYELPFILERLIPETQFILIGHSDGGSISFIFGAEKHPFLKGIITLAAHVVVEEITLRGVERAKNAWEQGKLKGLEKFHGHKTETIFFAWAETWLSPWFKNWTIENLLHSIEVPLLALQGKEDQYGTEKQLELIKARTSDKTIIKMMDFCGHSPHKDRPDNVSEVMVGFISSV